MLEFMFQHSHLPFALIKKLHTHLPKKIKDFEILEKRSGLYTYYFQV